MELLPICSEGPAAQQWQHQPRCGRRRDQSSSNVSFSASDLIDEIEPAALTPGATADCCKHAAMSTTPTADLSHNHDQSQNQNLPYTLSGDADPCVVANYGRAPVAFERGDGVWLFDDQGRQFLDGLAGIAVNALGHAHPA